MKQRFGGWKEEFKMEERIFDYSNGVNVEEIDMPKELSNFYSEIEQVCRKYNMSISHEDGHGSFLIERFDEFNMKWLREANKCYE